jgi:hypothetical protein
MSTSNEYVEEKDARRVALQTQINSILDSLAQRVQALEIENQATDLHGFNVDRLGGIVKRVKRSCESHARIRSDHRTAS